MNYIYKLSIIFAAIVLVNLPAFAQSSGGDVTGTIVDQNGAAIAGANVSLRPKAGGEIVNSQADESGKFSFKTPQRGIYRVSVSAAGFSEVSKEIELPLNGALDFSMSVGNISETVSVTATRTELVVEDTPVPVSVITATEIENRNLNTIGDIFRELPGTSSVNEGAFQVRPRIRGLDSNRVLVLVDGERLNNARTSTSQSGVEVGLVEISDIETLEVVRGSGSVLYGTDALAGTVNIITKDAPRKSDGGFRFGAVFNGLYSSNENGRRGNLAVTGSNKRFAFRASQSLERYGNYSTGAFSGTPFSGVTTDGEVLNSQSHGGSTHLSSRFYLNDNNELKLSYDRRRAANIGSPTLVGVFNAFFPYSNRDKFSGRYDLTKVNRYLARVSASAYYQEQDRKFINILNVPAAPPFFPGAFQFSETSTDTRSAGFDLQTNWLFGPRNFLTAGTSFFRDTNSDQRFVDSRTGNYQVFPPVLVRTLDYSPSVPDSKFQSFAAFVQHQFQATNRLSIVGGVRAERFSSISERTDGYSLPLPVTRNLTTAEIAALGLDGLTDGVNSSQSAYTGDIGAVFKVTENLSVNGRIGRSFRVPNLFERFFSGSGSIGGFVVANPDLKPETGLNIDTGVKFKTSKFSSSVNYFNNTYQDFLSSVQLFNSAGQPFLGNLGGLYQTKNISRARIQGIEAEFEAPIAIANGFLTPSGNFTYLRGDNLDRNEPLNTISPRKTVLNLRWQDAPNRYFAEWSTRIVEKQDRLSSSFLTGNGGAEPGFVISEIRGGYTFKRDRYRFSVNGGISNLFDRYYNEQFVYAPAKGRSFTIGTTWELN